MWISRLLEELEQLWQHIWNAHISISTVFIQSTSWHHATTRRLYWFFIVDHLSPVASRQPIISGGNSSTIYKLVETWVHSVDQFVYSWRVATTSNKSMRCPLTSLRFDESPLHCTGSKTQPKLVTQHCKCLTPIGGKARDSILKSNALLLNISISPPTQTSTFPVF